MQQILYTVPDCGRSTLEPVSRTFGKDQSNIEAATNQSRLQTIENFEEFVPATESPRKGNIRLGVSRGHFVKDKSTVLNIKVVLQPNKQFFFCFFWISKLC